jgi:uncharacterized protein (TIGR02118 family)
VQPEDPENHMFTGIVLYGHPRDAGALDQYYEQTHTPFVHKIPGLRRLEVTRIVATADGGRPPYYGVALLTFDGPEEAQASLQSVQGQAVVQDLAHLATGGATVLLASTQALS